MKRKITLIVIAVLIINTFILLIYHNSYDKKTILEDNQKTIDTTDNTENMVSIMLETSSGSGKYTKSSSNSFPTSGYVFNSSKSGCENGGTLDFNGSKIKLKNNVSDKCYAYFDVSTSLSTYIKNLYTSQGENGIYYHDSSLSTGAVDNSYRYAGASPNNYVCFGSNASPCPENNLYRIIGVFGNETKIIKNSSIGSYYWNTSSTVSSANENTWSTSNANIILQGDFLSSLGSLSDRISTHTWQVGGNLYNKIYYVAEVGETYTNEILSPQENVTYNAKIGLMYVSDYCYAASEEAYSTSPAGYGSYASENWLFLSRTEWTITRADANKGAAFTVSYTGDVIDWDTQNYNLALRPTFYLSSSVSYVKGNGSQNSPYYVS